MTFNCLYVIVNVDLLGRHMYTVIGDLLTKWLYFLAGLINQNKIMKYVSFRSQFKNQISLKIPRMDKLQGLEKIHSFTKGKF